MEPSSGYYNTFLVKIWRDEAKKTMRGHIQHVSTQEHIRFVSLEDMNGFIVNHLGRPSGDTSPQKTILTWSPLVTGNLGGLGEG
ncbi:MAG: hypothetical protein ACLFVD_02335 [Dehalococcoidia bacterium]